MRKILQVIVVAIVGLWLGVAIVGCTSSSNKDKMGSDKMHTDIMGDKMGSDKMHTDKMGDKMGTDKMATGKMDDKMGTDKMSKK